MGALFSNIWTTIGAFAGSYLFPSSIGVGIFWAAILPSVKKTWLFTSLASMSGADQLVAFTFATFGVAFLLAATARPFLRFLEGYTLPSTLRGLGVNRQRAKFQELRRQAVHSPRPDEVREKLDNYPRSDELILPTLLGNALRSGESYGWTQYGLSTPDWWTRLTAVADASVTGQLNQARAVLDFFVAVIALSIVLIPATVVVAAVYGPPRLYWLAVALTVLVPLWYRRAVGSVRWYALGMQALVDLNREPLAKALGYKLPQDIDAEIDFWRALTSYTAWGRSARGSREWKKRIAPYRISREAPS